VVERTAVNRMVVGSSPTLREENGLKENESIKELSAAK
jgi:hypothetical protein